MNVLKRPQEAVASSIERLQAITLYRKHLKRFGLSLFPLVLLTGFFTAGTCAGASCNTFPKVGEHWFYTPNHFFSSEKFAFWQNFTENKLICQVNHRTFATFLTLWGSVVGIRLMKLRHLQPGARLSLLFLIATLWMQLFIGVNVIWNSVPVWMASSHQIGAMTVLTALVCSMHHGRSIDPRHLKNLLGRLKLEDPKKYKIIMANIGKKKQGQQILPK